MAAPIGPDVQIPPREEVVLRIDNSLPVIPKAERNSPELSPAILALQVRELIQRSRETGSPRPLGLAEGLLAQVPESEWTPDVYLMRATVLQRLHRFDDAEADLERVLQADPDNHQAWLTRYSIALVRGDIQGAEQACGRLEKVLPGLVAQSCSAELASMGDAPEQAFQDLQLSIQNSRNAHSSERDYALVTLADMTSRLEMPVAGKLWGEALLQAPDDLYRRARFADWLLLNDQAKAVLPLTRDYVAVDTLAVLRAVAMTDLQHPQRQTLTEDLQGRFQEASWRGEFLHQWEYARFLLDVQGDARAGFEMAEANWQTQRAYPDRQLLVRAAIAAGKQDDLKRLGVESGAAL
tara:strand:+ start:65033 stop:66088 length:1056 start_codon:yes stop_codon:yes gene_type:complete